MHLALGLDLTDKPALAILCAAIVPFLQSRHFELLETRWDY